MESSNLIQVLTYAAMMASTIFVPILAESYGATPEFIGLIVGIYNTSFFFSSYLFGWLSDRYGGRLILRIGLLVAAACFAFQVFAKDSLTLLLIRCLVGFSAGTFLAALAGYAAFEHKGKMGRFTGFGSLGWAIGAILAGFISNNQLIFLMSGIFFLVSFFLSLSVESDGFQSHKVVEVLPWTLLKRNARIYIPYFLRGLGAQAIWSIFPLYLLWTGADKLLVGVLYFTNLFSQFFIMSYVEKFKNLYLVNIGLLCSVFTFLGYALFPKLPVIFFLQLLLALSFSTLQVGAVQELMSKNVEQSTAYGLLNSLVNLGAVVGPFLAGFLIRHFGYLGVMWAGVLLAFAGLISFTVVLE